MIGVFTRLISIEQYNMYFHKSEVHIVRFLNSLKEYYFKGEYELCIF